MPLMIDIIEHHGLENHFMASSRVPKALWQGGKRSAKKRKRPKAGSAS